MIMYCKVSSKFFNGSVIFGRLTLSLSHLIMKYILFNSSYYIFTDNLISWRQTLKCEPFLEFCLAFWKSRDHKSKDKKGGSFNLKEKMFFILLKESRLVFFNSHSLLA